MGKALGAGTSKIWSEQEDANLVRRVGMGLDLQAIAYVHSRTEGAISSRIRMMNWCRKQNNTPLLRIAKCSNSTA